LRGEKLLIARGRLRTKLPWRVNKKKSAEERGDGTGSHWGGGKKRRELESVVYKAINFWRAKTSSERLFRAYKRDDGRYKNKEEKSPSESQHKKRVIKKKDSRTGSGRFAKLHLVVKGRKRGRR